MRYRLIIAEDDLDMAELLAIIGREVGFDVLKVHNGEQAVAALHHSPPDVLLTDLRLPEPDGLALLKLARDISSDTLVVMITGYATVQDAVSGFKAGLYDLITKPFNNAHLRSVLLRIQEQLQQRHRGEVMHAQLSLGQTDDSFPVMHSHQARRAQTMALEASPLDISVLLLGESGTGKGEMAKYIHANSPLKDGPFFSLNCAAVSASVMENELFGHERGAFTGATSRKRGLLELADGGTLLLDEINSTNSDIQARLLQFIQERRFMRVGGERMIDVNVRLIAASNEDLQQLVDEGRFRADLYYRLNVFPIPLPPLRERQEDIQPLAERFIARYALRYNKPARIFDGEALDALCRYHWPGNIRELENIIQRAVVLAQDDIITRAHLPAELIHSRLPVDAGLQLPADASLTEVEAYWINYMLVRCGGNKSEAARRLGIDVSTLHRRLRQQ